jgi:hypothetical protein
MEVVAAVIYQPSFAGQFRGLGMDQTLPPIEVAVAREDFHFWRKK